MRLVSLAHPPKLQILTPELPQGKCTMLQQPPIDPPNTPFGTSQKTSAPVFVLDPTVQRKPKIRVLGQSVKRPTFETLSLITATPLGNLSQVTQAPQSSTQSHPKCSSCPRQPRPQRGKQVLPYCNAGDITLGGISNTKMHSCSLYRMQEKQAMLRTRAWT